jgi:tetratricopeptide (TPR) repeat protein
MRSLLNSSVGKLVISATVLLTVLCYLTLASREFLAAYFAAKKNLRGVQIAIRLEPGDADYRYQLGRYYWFVQRTADAAIPPYQAAIRLNPFEARSWFDLAAIYQYLSDAGRQENALQHAVEEDPTTPDVAWEAANLYAVQGQTDQALKEFRVVLENDPYRPWSICYPRRRRPQRPVSGQQWLNSGNQSKEVSCSRTCAIWSWPAKSIRPA